MRPALLLTVRNLRRRPGQLAVLFILVLTTSAMAYLGLVVSTDYGSYFDRLASEPDAPAALVSLPKEEAGQVTELLQADGRVTDVRAMAVKSGNPQIRLNGLEANTPVLFFDMAAPPELGKIRILSESVSPVPNPVWVPRMLATQGSYHLGDELTLKSPEGKATFHIQGFFESIYGSSTSSFLFLGLSHAGFTGFDAPGYQDSTCLQVQGPDGRAVREALSATTDGKNTQTNDSLDSWRNGTLMAPMMFVVLIVALAILLGAVMVVLVRFVVRNVVAAELGVIGTLRAGGFTTGGVIWQLMLTFGLVAALASGIGTAASSVLFAPVEEILNIQTGLAWRAHLDPALMAVVLGLLVVVFALAAGGSAVRLRRVSTVEALRGGTRTHTFKRTWLPLDSTPGPLSMLLGVKAAIQQIGQNLALATTCLVLSFASVFTLTLAANLTPQRVVNMLIGDFPEVMITARDDVDAAALSDEAGKVPGVSKAFCETVVTLKTDRGSIRFDVLDDPAVLRYTPVAEGRLPIHANEVAVSRGVARRLGLSVGDVYAVAAGGQQTEYLVTGLTSPREGVMVTAEGFKVLSPAFRQRTINIYTAEGADVGSVMDALSAAVGSRSAVIFNNKDSVGSRLGSYLGMLSIAAGAAVAVTVCVVSLVMLLVTATMIARTRRELGVKKALGFTRSDLTRQVLWSYLPTVAVASLTGAVLAAWCAYLAGTLLGGGTAADLRVSPAVVLGGPALIVVLAWAITWLATLRIGSISARALITE